MIILMLPDQASGFSASAWSDAEVAYRYNELPWVESVDIMSILPD